MKTKTYQHFEAKPCGRCGGSGHFAFNLKDGTICYGCTGRGPVNRGLGVDAPAVFEASATAVADEP